MDTKLLTKLLAIGLPLMLGRGWPAEALRTASIDNLRISWSDDVMAEGYRAVCGDVRNVDQVSARGVAIRVVGLGSASQVISAREHYILAEVPAALDGGGDSGGGSSTERAVWLTMRSPSPSFATL